MEEKQFLNIEGSSGESVFFRPLVWCLGKNIQTTEKNIQTFLDKEWKHIVDLHDDRLLVLVGALLVENAINEFLGAIIPKYKPLHKRREFTFSIRIELARALRLCPSRIFNSADIIRDIRNDFVHDLSCNAFSKLSPDRLKSMRDHYSKFDPHFNVEQKNDEETFRKLVSITSLALLVYRKHVIKLNEFIHSEELFIALKQFCKA